jgi:ABC-type Zn uptake system ZnuABC Zn-binding protein ZnuA
MLILISKTILTIQKYTFIILFSMFFFINNSFATKIITTLPIIHSILTNIIPQKELHNQALYSSKISIHDYTLTTQNIKDILSSDTVIIISPTLEQETYKIAKENNKNIIILENLIPTDSILYFSNKQIDYHFFTDPITTIALLNNLIKVLSEFYPKNINFYNTNTQNFNQKLLELHTYYFNAFSNISNKNIITYHNGLSYFIKRYNLKNAKTIIEDDIQLHIHEHQITTQTYIDLQNTISLHNINCILLEEELQADVIIQDIIKKNNSHYTIVAENSDNYIISLENNFNKIITCLK